VTILPRTRTGGQNGNVRGLFVYVEKSHVISFPLNEWRRRSFISCQIFREIGSVGQKMNVDDHQFQKLLKESGK
jgi:hypothetical protein